MEKLFWRRITRDEIITDYNTKAVNVDAYQKIDNNSDTAGKAENETRQQMNNLFQSQFCNLPFYFLKTLWFSKFELQNLGLYPVFTVSCSLLLLCLL